MKLSDILNKTETYATDEDRARCNDNGIVTVAKHELQEIDTYIRKKQIDGTYKYVWNDIFVAKLITSIETGEYQSFGSEQRKIAEEYVIFLINGIQPNTPEYIIPLDTIIGTI